MKSVNFKSKRSTEKVCCASPLTYAEIDIKALRHNVRQILKFCSEHKVCFSPAPSREERKWSPTQILAVIKADAYGHGMPQAAKILQQMDIGFFGVSDLSEGVQLRELGIKRPILLFESPLPESCQLLLKYNLMPTICSLELAQQLNDQARKARKVADVHISVDTGMGRLGVWYPEAEVFIAKVMAMRHLRIMGLMTHFPAADTDRTFTRSQIKMLYELVTRLDQKGLVIPYVHAANSMGLIGYQSHVVNLARPGLMLYGLYPHKSLRSQIDLKPVMRVHSKIIFVKEVPKGQSISYGRTFFTRRKMKIAVVPIGYHDGYFRAFSNKSMMLVNGVKCPVVGRVTMDQTMIDVSRVPNVKAGMSVVVMGSQKGQQVTADDLADCAGTINYEIVCNLGNRLERVYK